MTLIADIPAAPAAQNPSAAPLRVLCWVAGGPGIGMGHVMRSLELARTMEASGIEVVGFVANEDATTRAAITAAGRALLAESDHAMPSADVVLVDRPSGVDKAVLAVQAAQPGLRIAALDNFDMESGEADLVVNLINHHPTLRRPIAPHVRYFEGPAYAIIRREFVAARGRSSQAPARGADMIVSFGGADPTNHTGLVLAALAAGPSLGVAVRVVIGPAFTDAAGTAARARAIGAEVLEHVTELAQLFAGAHFVVCGGGTTMLEAACVGTPALVLPQNVAEARFAASLAAQGVIRLVPADAEVVAVRRELETLLNDQEARGALRRAAFNTVDGLGGQRIADLMLTTFKPISR